MANFQYKTASGGSWTDVQTSAYHGTMAGTAEVIYPESQARDGTGRPCAAIGVNQLSIKSQRMSACGMDWWQGKFSSSAAVDVEFWLTGKDPRTNNWRKWTGWLLRPVWSRIQVGSGSINTLYEGVELVLDMITETT